MNQKYEIGDNVWIIKNRKPTEMIIEALKTSNDKIIYLFNASSCGGFENDRLYKTKRECELSIAERLSNASYKIGDIILVLHDEHRYRNNIRDVVNINIITGVDIDNWQGIEYTIKYSYDTGYDETTDKVSENEVVSIKKDFIMENFEVDDLIREHTMAMKHIKDLEKQLIIKTDKLSKKIKYNWCFQKKKENILFGRNLYDLTFENK